MMDRTISARHQWRGGFRFSSQSTAAGQVLRTALTAKGVQAKAESRPGSRATFESEVQMTGAGAFMESGRISYGKAGGVTFLGLTIPPSLLQRADQVIEAYS